MTNESTREFEFPVERGHVLAFARAIGEKRENFVSPTFAVTTDIFDPEFDRRPPPGQGWRAGPPASHLHVEQHFEYSRPLAIGEVLSARREPGRRWVRQGRSGRLEFVEETTFLLDQRGEHVVSAHWVDVHTTVDHRWLTDRQRVPGAHQRLGAADLGTRIVEAITRTQFVMYVGAAGDFHPLHHDDDFARTHGYPSVFAPGMLTMALTGRAITDSCDPSTLRRFQARFRAQVWPGDSLFVDLSTRDDDVGHVLSFTTRNQHGTVVLEGSVELASASRR